MSQGELRVLCFYPGLCSCCRHGNVCLRRPELGPPMSYNDEKNGNENHFADRNETPEKSGAGGENQESGQKTLEKRA